MTEEEKQEWESRQKSVIAMVEAFARQPEHIIRRYTEHFYTSTGTT